MILSCNSYTVAHVAEDVCVSSASYRIHQVLLNAGVNSLMLSQNETNNLSLLARDDSMAAQASRVRALSKSQKILRGYQQRRHEMPWNSGLYGVDISMQLARLGVDILHLHWIATSTVSLRSLRRYTMPIVWTMHDVWPVTAGCHCNMECEQWLHHCHHCPQLGPHKYGLDIALFLWFLRRFHYSRIKHLYIVTPSHWLAEMVQKSQLFRNPNIFVIPNPVDISIFSPQDKQEARRRWGIPENKHVLLFGCVGGANNPYKGFDLIIELLEILRRRGISDLCLVCFGDKPQIDLAYPVYSVGYMNHQEDMASLYNAADIFIHPSKQDNLPNTCIEAAGCGVPTCTFNTGGIPEVVLDGETGFIASQFNLEEMADHCQRLLLEPALYAKMSLAARTRAVERFAPDVIAKQYAALYQSIIV